MKKICVIPARLASMRFPKKVLARLGDKPLLQWVWEAAHAANHFDEVLFAIDSEETAAVIDSFGGKAVMTSVNHVSGTDRLIELMQKGIEGDIWVNWQADEPFITKAMIDDLLQDCRSGDVWTLKKKYDGDPNDPHAVKVVTDESGKALYFSRSPIPHGGPYYKHLGIYAYTRGALEKISTMSPSPLELQERLEQLRYLEGGLSIQVHETEGEIIGIDHPDHLKQAELLLVEKFSNSLFPVSSVQQTGKCS